jgi:hypothetical protein
MKLNLLYPGNIKVKFKLLISLGDSIKMEESQLLATQNPQLLEGVYVISTPSTEPAHEIQRRIIENACGVMVTKKRREAAVSFLRDGAVKNSQDMKRVLIVSKDEDREYVEEMLEDVTGPVKGTYLFSQISL